MRYLKIALAAAALLIFGTAAFAQGRPIVIENAWVRVLDDAVSAYFTVVNTGEQADRLLDISTPAADRARLYRTRIRSSKFTYDALQSLDVEAGSDERLRPGGVFVRLEGIKGRLAVGDSVPLTLRFEHAGRIEITARVSNQLLGNR